MSDPNVVVARNTDQAPVSDLYSQTVAFSHYNNLSAQLPIDPATGAVEGIVDLTGLLPEEDVTPATDVLNGIAYDAAEGRIFVTGKNWNKLFEIEIREK